MSERIPDRYLMDQFLDSPQIRKDLKNVSTPEELMNVFKEHGISFEMEEPQKVLRYVQSVLSESEVKDHPEETLHI